MSEITFGYIPCSQTPDGSGMEERWDEVITEAKQAEASGFDAFQIGEHHQTDTGQWPAITEVLAGVAAETETIELGTSLLLLPLYHPVHLAEQMSMVDIISGGRLTEMTFGAGYAEQDFKPFDIPLKNRPSLMEESLTVLPRLLMEDEVYHFGKRFTLRGVNMTPKPIQEPRPSIYAGAWTDQGCNRAARLADGWHTDLINTRGTLKYWADFYRDHADRLNKEPRVSMMREAWVAPTAEEAKETWREGVMGKHRFYYSAGGYSEEADPWLEDIESPEELTFEQLEDDRFVVGDPQDCIDYIEKCHETLGATHFALRFRFTDGPSHEETMEAIRLFGEEVIPHFQG